MLATTAARSKIARRTRPRQALIYSRRQSPRRAGFQSFGARSSTRTRLPRYPVLRNTEAGSARVRVSLQAPWQLRFCRHRLRLRETRDAQEKQKGTTRWLNYGPPRTGHQLAVTGSHQLYQESCERLEGIKPGQRPPLGAPSLRQGVRDMARSRECRCLVRHRPA